MSTPTASPVQARPLAFEPFRALPTVELEDRIRAVKSQMGDELLILGHHYQQDEVIRFADLRGDSYKLEPDGGARAERAARSSSAASTSWPRRPTS